ncbi:MAG: nucleotidyltransferase family protein [Clostridia bacterium]|nr:nucleotidyltransferase family protein [Clostridia bacterium]
MRICGIVAEYNPFHNGHKYLIEKIRESGFDCIVAVMSGNFVQRGESAVIEKHLRANQALLNGVDLVIELPTPFAVSSAEKFALGSVGILDSLGVVDSLCFGSECGNIDVLEKIADLNTKGIINKYLNDGITYAQAFEKLVENDLGSEYSSVLSNPNNILGIEYIKALNALKSDIKPFTVQRYGVSHDSDEPEGEYCSASYIRNNINNNCICDYMPDSAYEIIKKAVSDRICPVSLSNNERQILSYLRRFDRDYFSSLPDISEGIENRLCSSVREACSLEELYTLVKTKRYTMARVKRLVLSAYLGITSDFSDSLPPYIKVLGFNDRGREVLKISKEKVKKPVLTLASEFYSADEMCKKFYELECRATDLYFTLTPEILPCGREQTENAVIIK